MDTNIQLYVSRDGQEQGPYSRRVVKAMLKDGSLSTDDLAWHEGLETWQPLKVLLALSEEQKAPLSSPIKPMAIGAITLAALAFYALWSKGSFDEVQKTPPLSLIERQQMGISENSAPPPHSSIPADAKPSAENVPAPSLPVPSKEQTIMPEDRTPSPQESAKQYAKGVILKKLKAPATAKFVEIQIVTEEDPWFQVHAVVDAQNSFGALIRSHFLCAVKMGDDSKYAQSLFGTWENEIGWSQERLELHRTINHWGE